ncbi:MULTISPECIES: hypothetical protein [Oscillospiraceae]|uniref:hypothetical protein n=1 Tax=Oscillospiraceae TaxID=216572 RepID=UPI000B39AB1E|nr:MULTISPECIES: hypothetical protein [Oscillospiraceae]MBM6723335.1 hypothetical protein [Pseudoflavonifractor phocaeensis]OUO42658.1 hypothetical protein B5F88_04245 [Flavonifractor sp. An306]
MFGNKKMYKKGLEDALQANEDFSKKQEAALEELRREVDSGNVTLEAGLAKLGDDIHSIYRFLTAKEKAALYHLSTPIDIKQLDESERNLLVAVLFQLASDEGPNITEYQQTYLRGIQAYLGITNPQTLLDDMSVVGDIDSGSAQKAILQAVLEFLYLQDGDILTDEQEDFLSNFSVNRKQGMFIEDSVSRLYAAVGAQGVAEKYGVVQEIPRRSLAPDNYSNSQNNMQYSKAGIDKIWRYVDLTENFVGKHRHIETEKYFIDLSPFNYSGDEIAYMKIDKITGECTRTSIKLKDENYKGRGLFDFSYTVNGDIGYFVNYEDGPFPGRLFSVNFSADTAHLFSVTVPAPSTFHYRVHISASNRYVVLFSYHMRGAAEKKVPELIYYIDLLDNEKIYKLDLSKHNLSICDVRVLNDSFLVLAHEDKEPLWVSDCKFFWYEPDNDILTSAFHGMCLEKIIVENDFYLSPGGPANVLDHCYPIIRDVKQNGATYAFILAIKMINDNPYNQEETNFIFALHSDADQTKPLWDYTFKADEYENDSCNDAILYHNYGIMMDEDNHGNFDGHLTVLDYETGIIEDVCPCELYILFDNCLYVRNYNENDEAQWYTKRVGESSSWELLNILPGDGKDICFDFKEGSIV